MTIQLTKQDLRELTHGQVFGLTFVKADGSVRHMSCRFGVKSPLRGGDKAYDAERVTEQRLEEFILDPHFGTRPDMLAMAMLSDAQDLIARSSNPEHLETARKFINRAKYIITDFLVVDPDREKEGNWMPPSIEDRNPSREAS